jgi:hypothetical protein
MTTNLKPGTYRAGGVTISVGADGKIKTPKSRRNSTGGQNSAPDEKKQKAGGFRGGTARDAELWEVIGYGIYTSVEGRKSRVAVLFITEGKRQKDGSIKLFATGNFKYRIAWTMSREGEQYAGFVKDTRFDVWSHQTNEDGTLRLSEVELMDNWRERQAENYLRRDAEFKAKKAAA